MPVQCRFFLQHVQKIILSHLMRGDRLQQYIIYWFQKSDSSQTHEGHFFFIVKENPYDTKEFDTIRLQGQSTGLKIKKDDSCGYKKTQMINLLPNRKYTIIHSGMGGRVRIQEYFWTDSIGNLRVDPTRKRKVGYKEVTCSGNS